MTVLITSPFTSFNHVSMLLLNQPGFRTPAVFVIIFRTLLLVIASYHLALGQLVVLSECACPGRELRLECTAVGGFSTVWKGTAFDCPGAGNEILLRHSRFNQSGGRCNNGMIIGRSRNETFDGLNSTYTSQLTIHLPSLNATSNTLEGRTVQCVHDGVTVIGNHTIAYTRISNAPPPVNVNLAQVSRNVLTFQWDPVQLVCSDIVEYKVNATNCGLCPDATVNTSVTCLVRNTDLLTNTSNTNDTLCTLSVETTVCGFQSSMSESATAMLKVPGRPIISKVLSYYNFTSRQLAKINIQIESDSNEERFYISNGTDGSIISYAFDISFSDSESNCTLPITTLPVSSCVDEVCIISLANLTSLPCYEHSSQAEVAVYASNVLTDGPPSTTSLLNTSNSLFFVTYEPVSNSFSCLFVGSYENKSCEITYGAMDPTDQTCAMDNQVTRHVNSSRISDAVTVFIPKLEHSGSEFCFTAIGKTAAFTIAVEGTFRTGNQLINEAPQIDTSFGVVISFAVLLATLCAILVVVIVLLARSRARALKELSLLREREKGSGQRQNVAYEEINLTPSAIDTSENVAYGQL